MKKYKENIPSKINYYVFILITLTILPGILYYNSLKAPFIYDDIPFIVENPAIRVSDIEVSKFFKSDRPLILLTFGLNYKYGNLNTTGYHIVNILIHILVTILIFFLTEIILFYVFNKKLPLLSFIVTLMYSVHPVHTEVVTYIYNRSASLSTFFYLASLILFIKTEERKYTLYFFSLFFFILSLLSKQTALTLPFLIIVIDFVVLSNFSFKEVLKRKYLHIPYWIILIIFLVYLNSTQFKIKIPEPFSSITGYLYYLTQPYIIVKYISLLLIPSGLCIDHGITAVKGLYDMRVILPVISLLLLFISPVLIIKKNLSYLKLYLFSACFFIVTISPVVLYTVHIGERHLYLPTYGFFLALTGLYYYILKISPENEKINVILMPVIIFVFILSLTTIKRNKLYNDPAQLWSDVILKYPQNARAYNNRGAIYAQRNEIEKALSDYNTAIFLKNDYTDAYNNRGLIYTLKGEYEKAISDFSRAIELPSKNKAVHYHNRAIVYFKMKEYQKAILDSTEAINLNPEYSDAYYDRALIFHETGNYEKAISDYSKCIELNPNNYNALNNRGLIYSQMKKYDLAISDFTNAISLKPDFAGAYLNRGVIYYETKNYEKAISDYSKVIEISPDFLGAYQNRAMAYIGIKKHRSAKEDIKKLIESGFTLPEYLLKYYKTNTY